MSDQPQPSRSEHPWLGDGGAPSSPPPSSPPPGWAPPTAVGGAPSPYWNAPATDAFGRPVVPAPGAMPPGMAPVAPAPGSAALALILGIVGLVLCPLVASIPAWIVGAQARKEASSLPGRPGQGMATAGMVLGIIGTVLWVLIVVICMAAFILAPEEFEAASTLRGVTF